MLTRIPTIIFIGLLFAGPVFAQNAERVLRMTSETYEKAMADIDDMKMVIRPEGDFGAFDQMITYYKKEEGEGSPTFRTYTEFKGGLGEMVNSASAARPMDMFSMGTQLYEKLKDEATYEGTETVDGAESHVIYVPNMTALMEEASQQYDVQNEKVDFSDARIYIDAEHWVVRKMSMVMDMKEPGGAQRKMNMDVSLSDFRRVGSLYYPFAMKSVMENPMTPEQRSEMQQQKAQIESMLDQLPEEQKAQMRKMMSALGEDQIVIAMVIEELTVNEGVPAGYFD